MKFNKRDLLPPSGFPELSIAESIAIRDVTALIRDEFELAGFSPLETSLVERPEVLYAKSDGEILTQGYGLRLLNVPDGVTDDSKDLGLRYDHTVPLARFVAAHQSEVPFPYRRYAIGPVFRGERAKDGRYRQFTQADIDIIGSESLDLLHDAEMVAVIARVFTRMDIGTFTIRIGHRKILQGLLAEAGVTEADAQQKALQEIDRLDKIGKVAVLENLVTVGITAEAAELLMQRLQGSDLTELAAHATDPVLQEGITELQEVLSGIKAYGVAEENYTVDLSIARGLAYYTGTVYETTLNEHQSLGSIASGGRYEDLAGTFTNRTMPGVGISIGLTRLMKRLMQADLYPATRQTVAPVLVANALDSEEAKLRTLSVAAYLREANINTEVYVQKAKLGKQMQFADRRGFTWVIIVGEETITNDEVTLRHLESGEEARVAITELATKIVR